VIAPTIPAARSWTWAAQRVTLSQVAEALVRLNRQAASHEVADDEQPHTRSSVMNLVAVVPETRSFERLDRATHRLAAQHPLRVVAVRVHGARGRTRIDARVTCHLAGGSGPMRVHHDHAQLEVSGEAAGHLRQLVEPLLRPDLTTVVWWEGTPPFDHAGFEEVAGLGQMLVVDSAVFADPARSLARLAGLAARASFGIADLDWGRNAYWREQLAQVFEPAGRRPFLDGLESIEVAFAAGDGANPVPAALMAGWLIASLRRRVRPLIHAVELPGCQPGDLAALRLRASAGKRSLDLRIARRGAYLELELSIGGSDPVRQVVPVAGPTDAELLSWQASHGRRDEVYGRALAEAAALVEGRR
jgi:glucose-6-phosphate dehydrogenase assembly protein OpcA